MCSCVSKVLSPLKMRSMKVVRAFPLHQHWWQVNDIKETTAFFHSFSSELGADYALHLTYVTRVAEAVHEGRDGYALADMDDSRRKEMEEEWKQGVMAAWVAGAGSCI